MYECKICKGKEFVTRPYNNPFSLITKEMYLQICKSCGFGMINIPLNKKILDNYYESDEYYLRRREKFLFSRLETLPHSRAISQYNFLASHFDFRSINSLLDFGAGSAVIIRTIKIRHNHIITTAIELSKSLKVLLEKCDEIDNIYKELPIDMPFQDVIIISQTLEHLSNPIVIIEKFKKILSGGGYLFIEVPNCPFPLYYNCQKSFLPHISFFTKKSFMKIAKIYDFEPVWIGGVGFDLEEACDPKMVSILKRTGFIYAFNDEGDILWVLLRKKI